MSFCSAALRRVFWAVLWLALPAAGFAAGAGFSSQDKAFLAARDAYLAGDGFRLAGYVEKLRGHACESYPGFWGLKLRVEQASPEELRAFLARNEGTFLAEQLRREWLRVLGKNGQWELFRQELPNLARADAEVAGYALQERWLRQDATVSADIRSLWKSPRVLPAGALPVAEAMVQSGEFTLADLRDRFRLLVQAGLMTEARRIAERMPASQALPGDQISEAAGSPAAFLERPDGRLKTAAGRELIIVALTALSRSDPQQAFRLWDGKLRDSFPEEDRQYVWAALASQAARHHLPEALEWFGKARAISLPDEQLVWYARIALRQENWAEVRAAIGRMSPAEKGEPVWTYWQGRALLALGMKDEGRALLGKIAGEHHFYGLLAAEDLGMALQIPPKAAPPTLEELTRVAAEGGIKRALALYGLGLRTEGLAEWLWAVRAMDDRSLLAAAELAGRNRIWDRAINTADRTLSEHDFSLRYPAPYGEILQKHARVRNLDEPLVLALVRQESRFIADAKSSAGAAGLMQLMPSTASRVAKKIGMKNYSPSRLAKPEANAALGTSYLRQMLDWFGGNATLACAAYNAGPGRARRWRDARAIEGAIYVETIPFTETRQYVKKVLSNAIYYAALRGEKQRSLKSRLGPIDGAAAANGANGTGGENGTNGTDE